MHPPEPSLGRHQLVRILPAAWDTLFASRPDLGHDPVLQRWSRKDWPLIVRRPMPGDSPGVPLGLPLPPAEGKRRIAIEVSPQDIHCVMSLPDLTQAVRAAPFAWRPVLRELAAMSGRYGVQAGVFGSLGWQWLTGLEYVHADSDIDIAWSLPVRERIVPFLRDLADIEARAPMRLDGELVRDDGAAVNWREVWAGQRELALKTRAEVVVCSREQFLGVAA